MISTQRETAYYFVLHCRSIVDLVPRSELYEYRILVLFYFTRLLMIDSLTRGLHPKSFYNMMVATQLEVPIPYEYTAATQGKTQYTRSRHMQTVGGRQLYLTELRPQVISQCACMKQAGCCVDPGALLLVHIRSAHLLVALVVGHGIYA